MPNNPSKDELKRRLLTGTKGVLLIGGGDVVRDAYMKQKLEEYETKVHTFQTELIMDMINSAKTSDQLRKISTTLINPHFIHFTSN